MEKRLGKIKSAYFGLGGYENHQLGLSITLGNEVWVVSDFKGGWDAEKIVWTKNCMWTEQERSDHYSETVRFLSKILNEAGVSNVNQLEGIPVMITFQAGVLKSWRILTEVL